MKRIVLLIALVVGLSSLAYADSCAVGTFGVSSYGAPGFSCTIGDLTFSNFSYTPAGSNGLSGAQVTVTPLTGGNELGFMFTAGWGAASNQSYDSFIDYTITAPSAEISDLVLSIGGFGTTGTGFLSVSENASNGTNLYVCFGDQTCTQTDSAVFDPVASLDVSKDILVVGGEGGTASLSAVVNTASEVPEPATLTLLGTGLLGLAGVVRRKLRSRS